MMRHFIIGLSIFLLACFAFTAQAQEKITQYDVQIEVQKSGDLIITETINIQDGPTQQRRGIFRELYKSYEFMGVRQDYDYDLISIKRDGQTERYSRQTNENGIVWQIGNASIYLPNGSHKYEIKYRVADQTRRHLKGGQADKDEIYWNATGTFWPYPIENATATLIFPQGAEITEQYAYTGSRGATGGNYAAQKTGNRVQFKTTRQLRAKEGLSVSASIKPGLIAPMSQSRINKLKWIRTGGPIMLGAGGLGLLGYYLMMWFRVGRDPMKPAVFPRYVPPENYSAAAVHHIHHKGFRKMNALTSTLMSLGVKNVVDVRADKTKTTITSMLDNRDRANLLADERKLLDIFFGDRDGKIVMDHSPNIGFYKDVTSFTRYIAKNYGRQYHRANAGWGLIGMAISLGVVIFVMNQPVAKSGLPFLGILLAIGAMNILFFWLLRAPTKRGAQISSEIDGFKLYLGTAEKVRINTADPLGDGPPAMTVELYERFMPYALALGVEKPWTKQFEATMPREAKAYQPSYAHGDRINIRGGSPFKMSEALATAMTAGVAAAAPVSQSSGSSGGFSSGSSGGGFSGGGGGGGGGGSW